MDGTKNVLDTHASFNSGAVAEETAGMAAGTYAVLRGIRELFLCLHTVDIADKGDGATEEFSHKGSISDSRCVGAEGVRSYVLVASGRVDSQGGRLEPFLENIVHGNAGQLGGGLKCWLDDIDGVP